MQGHIEHVEINYDTHNNAVRPRTGRTYAVCKYDAFFNNVFKNFDILLKNTTEIGVVNELSVQNLNRVWSTTMLADRALY